MKGIVIHGSPRRGNTWDVFLRTKKIIDNKLAVDWEIIELSKLKLPQCIGCFNCILKGEEKCLHKNIIEDIYEKIQKADFLIITSPVYSMNVTGVLKTFIDHMSFKFHRPSYFKKKALVITTTAGAGHTKVAKYIEEVLEYWGISDISIIDIAYRSETLTEKHILRIEKLSSKFAKNLASGKFKKPKVKSVVMYNTWKVLGRSFGEDSADYKYWSDAEFDGRFYAKGVKVGVISKCLGVIARKVMLKVKG